MPIFPIFIFGAIILGAGAMLSPAWPTSQPRVGLAAAFSLAIIIGGAIFFASLFGWNTLVIDYLLFALVVGIFLGGTLSVGQTRAEARGEVLEDADQGWTGPQDLAMFAFFAVAFAAPVFLLPLPNGTTAQSYSYLALVTRESGTLDTLAPYYPQVSYLYSPGFNVLTAYLSQQLNLGIPVVQFSVGAVLALLNVWLAYDFGSELREKRLGRTMALTMFFSLGLFGALLNGHYPALLGLAFAQAMLIYALRYLRHGYPVDAIAAGLMLGAVVLSHPGMTIVLLLGYVPWLGTLWLAQPRPTVQRWLVLALAVPLVALIGIAPWLASIQELLSTDIASPFERMADNVLVMLQYHGLWVVPIAAIGGWIGWVRRDAVAILAIGWLFFVLDFSSTGGMAALVPFIDRYSVPLGIAWHGPIIPYTLLGGAGLLWLWETYGEPRFGEISYRRSYVIYSVGIVLVIIAAVALPISLVETGITNNDIAALAWVEDNTPPEARLLNHPVSGLWAPGLSERATVYYPYLPFATEDESVTEVQAALLDLWENPTDSTNEALLTEHSIDYVVVPEAVSELEGVDYLTEVYAEGGAVVYRVNSSTLAEDSSSEVTDAP